MLTRATGRSGQTSGSVACSTASHAGSAVSVEALSPECPFGTAEEPLVGGREDEAGPGVNAASRAGARSLLTVD